MDEASTSTHNENTFDIVVSLIAVPFNSRNQSERRHILSVGRPTPHLAAVKTDKRKGAPYWRSFKCSWYNNNQWLTGSVATSSLYCWPCVLLSRKKSIWNSEGYFDLKNLSRSISIHANSKEHVLCHVALKRLEKSATPFEEVSTERVDDFANQCKETVRKNRELFKRLIDVIVVFCKCQVSSQDDEGSSIKDVFNYFVQRDSEVQTLCEQLGETFARLSLTIQNDLIECINEEIAEYVQSEIAEASCFSIQVDDVTDITERSQCSIIARFVDVRGDTQERFIRFHDVTTQEDTKNGFYNVLKSTLEDLAFREKLVAHCYDGRSVAVGDLEALLESVKTEAPEALFVHSTGYPLNLVLQNGAGCIPETRVFFGVIQTFAAFLRSSVEHSDVFRRVFEKYAFHVDSLVGTSLDFIASQRESLILMFSEVLQSKDISLPLRVQVDTFLNKLNDFHFVFLLVVYSELFKVTAVLDNVLRNNIFNVSHCSSQIDRTIRHQLQAFRNSSQAKEYIDAANARTHPPTAQRAEKYRDLYFEIIDNLILQLTTRFKGIKNLEFLELVDTKRFDEYDSLFPNSAFRTLKKVYPSRFDLNRLKVELEVVYADRRFRSLGVSDAVKLLVSCELKDILKQTYNLFCLVATLPVSGCSTTRLGRVQTCLRGSTTRQGLVTSAIPVEREVLEILESRESWYNDVIFRYASKRERDIDLVYKKSI